MKVFISHSSQDSVLARTVAAALQREGLEPWLAENEILPGDNWAERVSKALNECDAMVALVTADSGPPSHVHWEMSFAIGNIAYRKRLIPVLVGDESDTPTTALPWILALCDLQAIQAAGASWVVRLLECLVEAQARGDASKADAVRQAAALGSARAGCWHNSARCGGLKPALAALSRFSHKKWL